MLKNNKRRIEELLRDITEKYIQNDDFKGVTTEEISEKLSIRRNLVSQYLNELVEEKKAMKIKTRPVLFTYIMENKNVIINNKNDNVFNNLVGYNGSLREAVEKCKAAVFYPSKDMSVLLTGDSGVGKSYIASLIHRYAEEQGKIKSGAPFIIFNCADYADNPELLSANLFGYVKGSFTGAEKEHLGALELADGGYLFLDEVHRLSSEGQEKLFVFMDKGVFKRLGESKAERRANVRFIFATTENPKEALLQTFRRRIPMIINIPKLDRRPVDERITMIYKFFKDEALKIDKDIYIHRKVINYILSQKNGGNVGSLKNIIKLCCALAYKEQQNEEIIKINRIHLCLYEENFNQNIKQYYFEEYMKLRREDEEISEINLLANDRYNRLNELIETVEYLFIEYQKHNISISELRKSLTIELNRSLELIVYEEEETCNDLINNIYLETVDNTLKLIEGKYGIKYYGNTSKILTKVLIYNKNNMNIVNNEEHFNKLKRIKNILKKEISKPLIISENIISNLENNLACELDIRVQIIIILYVFTMMGNESSLINAIIVAHGYSTASSIASVANQLYGEFVFQAFDMPIDSSPIEVKNKIKHYISEINTSKGTIILVDMGSLVDINLELESIISGDLGIINNITTNIALDIAGRIINGQDVESMITGIEKNNPLMCKLIKAKSKKKAILTTCISGIGTAIKVRNLIKECIGNADIEVKEYEYAALNLKGKNDKVFSDYDVKLIISTTKLDIEGVKTILIHDLISENYDDTLFNILEDVTIDKNINNIKQDIIKMFSMDNLISRMTILNPKKIINEVESIILGYERILDKRFKVDLKMTLYMHISVMIERIMLKQGLEFSEEEGKCYRDNNIKFIDISNDIFKAITDEYNLVVTEKEIFIIQSIIESRIGKLNF
ncbi:Transcriptional regulator containing an AAA-type ATPase domain and a DNA-binding domain [Clostridium cavendishii DSM 21758]|uniref:Transcriptional regulator containing an AAA-type ATPase domain and a DNA-binding domain n=1 Tax=Clostridium cavendishii DSM 21758 TaxID=1121302 RepID=A0A1M6SML6_9CLOT|nr:sigma 54-interacting transcriptional regulator [Clostridium cavendishii]SHK45838.1 Transcriptional regulator containing an AAA-type ATPase domain and a DNA-binding domain [Clostridium cavendishii DSM 21758]